MSQTLTIILISYAVYSIFIPIVFSMDLASNEEDEDNIIYKSPKGIYNTLKVNWFGAVSIFILLIIACPLGYIFYAIPKILFTVGRK